MSSATRAKPKNQALWSAEDALKRLVIAEHGHAGHTGELRDRLTDVADQARASAWMLRRRYDEAEGEERQEIGEQCVQALRLGALANMLLGTVNNDGIQSLQKPAADSPRRA